jgi:hypothetical protein
MRVLRRSGSFAVFQSAQALASATVRAFVPGRGVVVGALVVGFSLCAIAIAQAKPFEDYIKPMPTVAPLSSASWGTAALPRDLSNGIESAMGAGVHPQWYYWDGQIIRANDGKYHMFMSTFDANSNFGTAWMGSDAYHAISETNVLGPYVRKDFVYTNNGSHKGHNVSAVELPDGTYAVIVSEIVPFTIYTSSSLDGPWKGCQPQTDIGASNISMFPRHDGKFQIVERHGQIAISDTLCGHYVKKNPTCSYTQSSDAAGSIYVKRNSIPGVSNPQFTWQEDPHIWRSGGTYHVIYSGSGDRVGWHVYSPDGITGWKDNGYAWSPRDYKKIFCYEGSTTCNAWYKMERPGVVLQDGHPTHITWAVSDVDKDNQVTPGTNHGTKVIVVPFDGEAFDADFGTGGGSGAGGSTGAGGATGAGGVPGVGGSTGAGGASGGNTGTTSNTGSGGMGAGGSSSDGGTAASGGASGRSDAGAAGGSGGGGNTGSGGSSAASGGAGGSSSSASGGKGGSSVAAGGSSGSGGSMSGRGGSSSTSTASAGGNGGSTSTSTGTSNPGSDTSSGCGCVLGSGSRGGALLPGLLLTALGMMLATRRRRRR